uniref:Uncharacterized protein n=1 Tax=Parascaris equorum TaxID=6256 RepID=A0A914R838_PAREQ
MVRMNNVYGPRQARSKLIPKFTTLAIEGKPYPLMGETYNIGTDFEKRNYDLTLQIHDIVAKLLNR